MNLVVINGSAESGKDELVKFIQEIYIGVLNMSTIDPVKEALIKLGWNGEKTPEDRQWMVDTKQRWIQRYNGYACVNYVEREYNALKDYNTVMFMHCREPEEIQKIVNRIPNTTTLLVKSNRGIPFDNGADDVVDNYNYDHVIINDGTLDDLRKSAYKFMDRLMLGYNIGHR